MVPVLTGRRKLAVGVIAYAMMQFLFAPIIGGLSDRFGRRPVLLTTLFLLGLDYAIMAWAPTLVWLFIGRIISGIMGASWAAANSCVADVAKPEERGKFFGILGGAGASGFVLGPALGGILGEYGERLPFIAASILALIGTAVGILILKETLPTEKRRRFTIARANPLGTILQMAKTPLVLGFLLTIFVLQLAAQAQVAVWAYWLIERFGWSVFEIGISIALYGILLAIVQGGLTGTLIARLGERRTAYFGLMFGIPAYLCFAFAPNDWFVYVGILVGAASGFAFPAMQQMMSNRIAEDAQGELQGAVASTISITSIFGPVMMTSIFGAYADKQGFYFPGTICGWGGDDDRCGIHLRSHRAAILSGRFNRLSWIVAEQAIDACRDKRFHFAFQITMIARVDAAFVVGWQKVIFTAESPRMNYQTCLMGGLNQSRGLVQLTNGVAADHHIFRWTEAVSIFGDLGEAFYRRHIGIAQVINIIGSIVTGDELNQPYFSLFAQSFQVANFK